MRHFAPRKLVLRAGRCQDLDEHDLEDGGRPIARGRAGAEERSDERSEAPPSGGSPTGEREVAPVSPDPEVPARHVRRRFTTAYKLEILRKADACARPGEIGALLRREGLYSSHLVT